MARDDWPKGDAVIQRLLETPHRFDFHQAVELIERRFGGDGSAVGGFVRPENEVVRFRAHASLGFPKADIAAIDSRPVPEGACDDQHPLYRLSVNFLGLYGPASPLPAFYTEHLLTFDDAESALRDFLDLFHHRLVALHHRLWLKYRYYLRYRPGADDAMSTMMFSLLGLGPAPARHRLRLLHRERLLAAAGMMAMTCRSPDMLKRMISHYFDGLPTDIEPFVFRRVTVPSDQRARLGQANSRLGEDLTLGTGLGDMAGRFRIILGPLSFERFQTFLPNGREHDHLAELVNTLLREPLDFQLDLILDSSDRPALSLGGDNPCRLGWSSWLGLPDDDAEARVRLDDVGQHIRLPDDPATFEAA